MRGRLPRPTGVTGVAAALVVTTIAATAAFLLGRYPALPVIVPIHYAADGPDLWRYKSFSLVLTPVWVQLMLAVLFGGIAGLLLWRARPHAQTDDARASADSQRMAWTAEAVVLLALIWILVQAAAAVGLTEAWAQPLRGRLGPTYLPIVLTGIVGSILVGVRALRRIGHPEPVVVEDASHWRWNALYMNAADPALFVPARRGVGYTLNFGRPVAVVLMAVLLLAGIAAPYLLIRSVVWW